MYGDLPHAYMFPIASLRCVTVIRWSLIDKNQPQGARHSACYHRLNGSSSHVLTATSRSYRKAKNSIPHRIETSNLIEIKFGTVDYVGEATPGAKFHANPSMGGFSANR